MALGYATRSTSRGVDMLAQDATIHVAGIHRLVFL